jgi:hypothetical protein
VTTQCDANSNCQVTPLGAACVPKVGTCLKGSTRCSTPSTLGICTSVAWVDQACDLGCRQTALGAFCNDGTTTTSYSGIIQYEARVPDTNFTDWSTAPGLVPAQSVLILSFRGNTFVDASTTDATGAYVVQVPSPFVSGDRVIAMLVHPNDAANGFAFAVAQPDLLDGVQSIFTTPGSAPSIWQWQIDTQTTPTGSTLEVTEALGSGAVRIYDFLRYAYAVAEAQYTKPGLTLVAWMRMNTAWSCGSCFLDLPSTVGSLAFQSQIFFPALAQNTSYWSDPVTAHELGHWVMQSYGVPPNEGGPHCVGVPTLPGQAWAEGWATGFSSIARNNAIYYDKQQGSMFWFDLSAKTYSDATWMNPTPAGGLLQVIDENDVASMLWGLASQPSIGAPNLFTALASTHMISAPFARGYSRHTWSVDNQCARINETDTGLSAPMLADFLDALRCGGASANAVDAVTKPSTVYPYPSASPLCP